MCLGARTLCRHYADLTQPLTQDDIVLGWWQHSLCSYWHSTESSKMFASNFLKGKSRNRRTFSKIEKLWFLQNYDDYNCIFGIKLKGLSLSFIWRVIQGTFKFPACVDYKIFPKKSWFLQKNAFLKLENIHNFDTYFHPLRNIVLKLFDDNCKSKSMWNFNTIILDGLIFKKWYFFMWYVIAATNHSIN